jgi:hypothetical protein
MTTLHDPEFEKVLRVQVDLMNLTETFLFFDNNNEIRHAVYPSEFETGSLHRIREDLMKAGVLKAVVHVNAWVEGNPQGYGTRTTVVEHLPSQTWNTLVKKPYPSMYEAMANDSIVARTQTFLDIEE